MDKKLILSIGVIFIIFFAIFFRADVTKVQPKDFTPGTYYTGYNSEEPPDYRRIYGEYNGIEGTNYKACTKNAVSISNGNAPYKPNSDSGLFWFWAMKEADESVLTSYSEVEEGRYLFKVPKGTELIAIADSELVVNSQYPLSMYPSSNYSLGNHITYIVKLPEDKIAYKITYGSMEKWWLCANKTEPDEFHEGNKELPIYYIGQSLTAQTFYSGTVLGFSGQTGIPTDVRIVDGAAHSFLLVEVETAELSEDGELESEWTKGTIDQLYSGGP